MFHETFWYLTPAIGCQTHGQPTNVRFNEVLQQVKGQLLFLITDTAFEFQCVLLNVCRYKIRKSCGWHDNVGTCLCCSPSSESILGTYILCNFDLAKLVFQQSLFLTYITWGCQSLHFESLHGVTRFTHPECQTDYIHDHAMIFSGSVCTLLYKNIYRIWNEFSFHTVFMKRVVCFISPSLWRGDIKHTTSFINTVWNENSFQILFITC